MQNLIMNCIEAMIPIIDRPRQLLVRSWSRAQNGCLVWLHRWQDEAVRAGRTITRIAVGRMFADILSLITRLAGPAAPA